MSEDEEMFWSAVELGFIDCSTTPESLREWWNQNKAEIRKTLQERDELD